MSSFGMILPVGLGRFSQGYSRRRLVGSGKAEDFVRILACFGESFSPG